MCRPPLGGLRPTASTSFFFLLWVFVSAAAATAEPPRRTSSFFGAVTAEGALSSDLRVTASVDGRPAESADLQPGPFGLWFYSLDLPVDDPSTPEDEGGADGQEVTFGIVGALGGAAVSAPSVFQADVYQRVDLAVPSAADLELSIGNETDGLGAGETATWTLRLVNAGQGAASGLELGVDLPAGASFVGADGGASVLDGRVVWPSFDLTDGQTAERSLTLRVDDSLAADLLFLDLVARVADDGSRGLDPDPADNVARDVDALAADPDLVVTIDDGLGSVDPGDFADFVVQVSNTGTRDASGVAVAVALDPAVLFQTADFDGGEIQEGVVSWPLLDLAVGQTVVRTFRVLVPADVGVGVTRLEHRASAQPGNGPDAHPASNSAVDWTDVEQYAGLKPTVLDTTGLLQDPQTLAVAGSVAVTIDNDGNLDLTDSFSVAIFEDVDGDGSFGDGVDRLLGSALFDSVELGPLISGGSAEIPVEVTGFVSFRDQPLWVAVDSTEVIPELDESNNTLSTFFECVAPPPVRQFDPVVEMSWPADDTHLEEPNAKESMSTPIVVQLTDDNGDGRRDDRDDPDIVFVAADLIDVLNPRLRLRAIDGATGRSHWAVLPPVSDLLTFSLSGLAAGDLDGDGDTEIVVSTPSPPLPGLSGFSNHLTAYNHNGQKLWSTTWYETHPTGSHFTNRDQPTIADLDGNGRAEVIVGGNVFNHNGTLRWRGTAGHGYQSARNANKSDSGAISVVIDLDMDGTPEILAGNTAYRADGTIFWQSPLDDGYAAVGNFDDDDFPEVVVVARGTVRLHGHDGALVWGPVDLPGVEPNAGGAPTVADFDADGEPEIGVAGSDFYTVFETDGQVKWQRAVRDESSNQTGSTVFDFDADGRYEVVYRDEAYLYILAGDTGEVLFQDPVSSFTANEQPVVADVDGDGRAEIVVSSDLAVSLSGLPRRTTGLRVYGDRNGTWVGARSIWNQHAYSIDNVDDDGGIPARATYGWLDHNTFRANVSPLDDPASSPDLSLSYLRLDRGVLPRAEVTVRVGNGGAFRASAGIPVALYDGAPESGGSLLGTTVTTRALEPGSFEDVRLFVDLPTFGALELVAIVGDDGSGSPPQLWDCREANNRHSRAFDFEDVGLWAALDDGRSAVQVGETVTYAVRFGNGSPVPRSGVALNVYLPDHAVEPSADGGASISGDRIQWPAIDLAPGGSVAYSFSFRVDPALPLDVAEMTTRAWVRDDGAVPDPSPWDQSVDDRNTVSSVRADAGGPYSGFEGLPVTFDGSASSDRNGTVVAWAWDFDGDNAFDDGDGSIVDYVFPDDGEVTVRLRVTDDSGESAVTSTTVTLANLEPTVDAGSALNATEGDVVTLGGASFADPGTLDTHTVEVAWGDGETSDGVAESNGAVRASHLYVDDGSYGIQVCVEDDDGGVGCDTTELVVSNAAPEILDDGSVHLESWLPQHLRSDPDDQGNWQISDDGTSVVQTRNVAPSVLLSPFAVAGVTLEGEVRAESSPDDDFFGFVIGFEPEDFENPDADYLLLDWKKGVQYTDAGGFARPGLALSRIRGIPLTSELWSHEERPLYPEGSYEELARGLQRGARGWRLNTTYRFKIQVEGQRVRVWVDDELELDVTGDFQFGAGRLGFYNYSQENVRYRAFTAVGQGIAEGQEAVLSLLFLDPGAADVFTASVDWADGNTGGLAVERTDYGGILSGTHTYPDDGVFLAQACVDDGDEIGCGDVPYTVLNLAPSFEAGPDRAAFADTGLVVDVPFTDPGVLDSHTATIDWGDGTFETFTYDGGSGRIQAQHAYGADGKYPVEICLEDNGGARACDGFEVFWTDPFVDLAARAWSEVPAIRSGAGVTLGVEAANEGSLPVTGVTLSVDLPAELSFGSASDGGVYDPGLHRVVWTVGDLLYGERAAFTVEGDGPSGGSGTVTAVATVSHDGRAGDDVDPADDVFELELQLLDATTPFPILEVDGRGYGTTEGVTLEIAARIDDPTGSARTAEITWGDGSGTAAAEVSTVEGVSWVTASHRYLDDGLYTLRLCVTDGACQERFVDVRNSIPDLLEADENVDLRLWKKVDLGFGTQGPANWIPSADGSHVYQIINSQASVYYSDFPAFGTRLETEMWPGPEQSGSLYDDDFIGLVLGWTPGDGFEADGDFILISWKLENQNDAKKGLWVSRVTGRPEELWDLDSTEGVEVLAKAATVGNTGWRWERLYRWTVEYGPDHLRLWLDGSLEVDLYNPLGDFPAGSFGFYNYSQDNVMYRGVSRSRFFGVEGSSTDVRPLLLDGGELDTHTASIHWGDGQGPDGVDVAKTGTVSTLLGAHVYAEDGLYEGRACGVDDDGGRGCGVFEVEILNAPPTVDAGAPAQTQLGAGFEPTDISFVDPGVLDTHTVQIDWGDGSESAAEAVATGVPGAFTVEASHVFTSSLGDYLVTVCATDDEGATGCAEKTVTVVGTSAPRDLIATVERAAEGDLALLTGSFADSDSGDVHTADVDWGDGSPIEPVTVVSSGNGGSVVAEHEYGDDGSYPVRWCVTDAQGFRECLDVVAEVSNRAPVVGEAGGEPGSEEGFHRWRNVGVRAGEPGVWTVSDHGRRVTQRSNDRGTFFFGPSPVMDTRAQVTARMWNTDDDVIGMALGFEPGDLDNPDADYLMILWKRAAQAVAAGPGLKIVRIRGTDRDFWTRTGSDLELLGEGAVHGDRGWRLSAEYRFRFELTADRFRVWVNDTLEADIAAPAGDPFNDGRFALFTYAQEYAAFRDFEQQAIPEDGRPTHYWAGSDLEQWQIEDFWTTDTPSNWTIKNDGEYVENTSNSRPSALLSPEDHHWRRLRFMTRVYGDNDYFGLVIGYEPGDATNDAADYLLMVWKAATEDRSVRGLKLYRISGRPASYWDLTDTDGVTLLASGSIRGSSPYSTGDNGFYDFDVEPRPDGLRVWVNGTLEFDVETSVPSGRYGFYVYRQTAIRFAGARVENAGLFFEGQTIPPVGRGFADAGRLDSHVASVDWNDGSGIEEATVQQLSGVGTVLLPEHVFVDDVTLGATVCAVDDELDPGCGQLPVRVFNVAPTVDAGEPLEGFVGTAVALDGSFEDPGSADVHSYSVDWGDGTLDQGDIEPGDRGLVPEHVYAVAGSYAVTVCVTDDDGGSGCGATTAEIGDVRPGQTLFCDDEPFEDPSDEWQTAEIGDGIGSASIVDGRLNVTGTGSELYHGDDHGVFVYRELEGDFRVEVDLAALPMDLGGDYRKACLMVRASSAPDAARAMACYVPGFPGGPAWLFDARAADGGAAVELASNRWPASLPTRLGFVRRGDELRVSLSEDAGSTWTEPVGGLGGAVTLAAAPSVLQVGLMVASYDVSQSMTASFDDFRVCHKATANIPGIDPGACDAGKPLDVIYLLDLSESMTADYPGAEPGQGSSKLAAATLGLRRLHDRLALRADGGRTALLTYHGFNDVASNLAGAVAVRAPFSSDPASASAVLATLDDSDVAPLATTPTGSALEEALAILEAEGDTDHRTVVVLMTDGVPNIDREGRGSADYRLPEIQAISLTDESGAFLPWPDVAWLGGFNGAYGTFDGEPQANAMYALNRLVVENPGLKIYGVGLPGDGVELGTYNLDLVDYAGWVSGGLSFAPASHGEMRSAMDALLQDLECGVPGTAAVGGLLWNDLDGDGVRDVGEPGLPSVEVELTDGSGATASATTAAGGTYLFVDVPVGTANLRVVPSTLPVGIDQGTYDLDGGTLGEVTVTLAAYEIREDVGFGYRATSAQAPVAVDHTVCEPDPFDGPSLDPMWTVTAVGDGDVGGAEIVSGRLEVSSNGSSLWNEDHFHFAHRPAPAGDFRVEVEIHDVPVDPGGNDFRKGGLHLRSGLDPQSARLMVNYLPYLGDVDGPALQFGYRSADGGPSQSLNQVVGDVTLPIRLAIERRGTTHTVWYSQDGGATWRQETRAFDNGVVDLDLGGSPLVGVGSASYDPSAPMTLSFDGWAECRPDETPLPAPPAAVCDPAQPLDVVALLDFSGSMKSPFGGASDRLEAAKAVLGRWSELLAFRQDGSRLGLVVYGGTEDPAWNVERAARVWAGLSDPSALTAVLGELTADGISGDAGSAAAAAWSRAGQLLTAGGDPAHRPVLLWISDEPPTVDARGLGFYGEEGSPSDFDLRAGSGGFLAPGGVAWRGPFQGLWGTFAGEPSADVMDQIGRWKQLLPSLSIVGVGLDGDGAETPLVDHDLLEFASSYGSGAFYRGSDVVDLLSLTDQAFLTLVCE